MGKSRYGMAESVTDPLLSGYVVMYDGSGLKSAAMTGTGEGLSVVLSTAPHINSIYVDDSKIFFPASQSASADANCLDDYEEGTWTAAFSCGTSGTITIHDDFKTGYYTKIGNVVHAMGVFKVGSISSPVGSLRISLPITPNANCWTCGSIYPASLDNDPQLYHPTIWTGTAVAYAYIVDCYSGGFVDTLCTNVIADSWFSMEITYFV